MLRAPTLRLWHAEPGKKHAGADSGSFAPSHRHRNSCRWAGTKLRISFPRRNAQSAGPQQRRRAAEATDIPVERVPDQEGELRAAATQAEGDRARTLSSQICSE